MPCPKRACSLLVAHIFLVVLAVTRARESHGETWAVIVSSSRYWLNYRHTSNALGVYQAVKRLGIPDSRIILMLAEQPGCSPRNVYPGQLFLSPVASSGAGTPLNLLGGDAEVDYRGREVSVDSVLRVLTGHHLPGTPPSKRLRSGPASRVLLFLTGHGGDEFLKLHDEEELLAADIATAVHLMAATGRYGELLLVADTCQASTLFSRITEAAPNVLAAASSKLGQSSYAHHLDPSVGQHVVDQVSHHLHHYLWHLPPHPAAGVEGSWAPGLAAPSGNGSGPSLQQLLDYLSRQQLSSEVQVRSDLARRSPSQVAVRDFFGAALPSVTTSAQTRQVSNSAAAAALLNLAGQELGQGRAARGHEQPTLEQGHSGLPAQQKTVPLLVQLEAAGATKATRSRRIEIAGVAGAWVAAVLLTRSLLQPS